MKKLFGLFLSIIILNQVSLTLALTNNSNYLIVETGETISLSGELYKNLTIHVQSGGVVNVIPHDGGGVNIGYLNLIAPTIIIDGTINGEGVCYNSTGKGGSPFGGGGGGAGYGGEGGRGASGFLQFPGSGGDSYNTTYIANTGSYGYRAGYDSTFAGYGGASIRLDAIGFSMGSNAIINAFGHQTSSVSIGGGSGGCILIDASQIVLQPGSQLQAGGGPGGAAGASRLAAGGGGGGRIKIHQRNIYTNLGATMNVNGASGGGGNAAAGQSGVVDINSTLPPPTAPNLITPINSAEVGVRPTLVFTSNESTGYKFLLYQIIIAEDVGFNIIYHGSSQKDQDPGWGGKNFYLPNEVAAYSMPIDLDIGTSYYWSVSVSADNGQSWVDASSHYNMNTTTDLNVRPTIPEITNPNNGVTNINKLPYIQIAMSDPDGDTLTCSVTLSQDPSLTNPRVFDFNYPGWNSSSYLPSGGYVGITATCQLLSNGDNNDSLNPGTTYYCQATTYDHLQQSRASAIINFTTVARPQTPTVIQPIDNSIVTTKRPTLTFYSASPTDSSLQYLLELSANDFQTIVVYQSSSGSSGWSQSTYASGDGAQLTIPIENQLVPGIEYSWRCKAYDITNDYWSLMTPPNSFLVSTPPLVPVLVSPGDNYAAPDSQITFKIKAESEGGNTLTGKIEISSDQFQSILHTFDQNSTQSGWDQDYYYSNSVAAYTISENIKFKMNQQYQWRASFFDGFSWSAYSAYHSFSLANKLSFNQARIYPNPAIATNSMTIYYQMTLDAKVYLIIYNKLGKEVHRQIHHSQGGVDANSITIDISNFASGLYYYLLKAESGFGETNAKKPFTIIK